MIVEVTGPELLRVFTETQPLMRAFAAVPEPDWLVLGFAALALVAGALAMLAVT